MSFCRKQFLVLNSANRSPTSTSVYDCTFALSDLITLPTLRKVSLVSFMIPNTIYNIQTGVNDSIPFNRSSTNFVATVTQGNYTITNLISSVQTAMNAADNTGGYTVTYNSTTFNVTISSSASAFTLTWSSSSSAYRGMWKELGWTQQNTSSSSSQTSPNAISLSRPYSLLIDFKEFFGANFSTSVGGNRSSFYVPLSVNGGSLNYYDNNSYFEQSLQYDAPITTPATISVKLHTPTSSNAINANASDWESVLLLEGE